MRPDDVTVSTGWNRPNPLDDVARWIIAAIAGGQLWTTGDLDDVDAWTLNREPLSPAYRAAVAWAVAERRSVFADALSLLEVDALVELALTEDPEP